MSDVISTTTAAAMEGSTTTPIALAPASYHCAHGAVAVLGEALSRLGSRALVVHGQVGLALMAESLRRVLDMSGVAVAHHAVTGPCTIDTIGAVAARARAELVAAVVGVGGGRVIDVAKAAAAAAGLPVVTVPTSASSCAAIRAHAVLYTAEGAESGVRPLPNGPAACVVDLDVVATAPARLLASGVVDAYAKWHEFNLFARRVGVHGARPRAAWAMARAMAAEIRADAGAAMAEARQGIVGDARRSLSEVAMLLPGLVSGLAGRSNSMAVAHGVHDALTHLPGARAALHGERVGFGLVVQSLLAGDPGSEIDALVDLLRTLDQPRGLDALGCGDALLGRRNEIAARVAGAAGVRTAFGTLLADDVAGAIVTADAFLR
jgi:glycerol dehydrogenase